MAAEKEAPKEAPAPAAPAGAGSSWLPVAVVLVLVPAISFALAEFVLFPRFESRLEARLAGAGAATGGAAAPAHATAPAAGAHGAKNGAPKGEPTFASEFNNIVSNLAGSMKSRYIKVSFTAYSAEPEFEKIVAANRAKMLDATLGVLATLTLADLEDPTVKNKVRGQLVQAFETLLHERIVEEIYFSEFVIQ
jgi:flagellar FliL protein